MCKALWFYVGLDLLLDAGLLLYLWRRGQLSPLWRTWTAAAWARRWPA